MICFSLSQLTQPLEAVQIGPDVSVGCVATDTRSLASGSLFIALEGPRFDGHDFVDAARSGGAAAALVSRELPTDLPLLKVEDTRIGLGRLARLWRRASGIPLVAVTGSNGKTTVKEMIAAILARRGSVLATEGNLNNEIGVPITLARLQDQKAAVVEMGASRLGEIDYLSRIAEPTVAVLTNVGRAHLEGFGTLEGVARAKAEILNGLAQGGCFVFNLDDRWAPLWTKLSSGRKTLTFGMTPEADIACADLPGGQSVEDPFDNRFTVSTPAGEVDIDLPLPGRHNRMNALAAIGAAVALGVELDDIRDGLTSMPRVEGRLMPVTGRRGARLIDDSYNANPESVVSALEILAKARGRRFVALGELAEMGEGGTTYYQELGSVAKRLGIEHFFALEEAAPAANAFGSGGRVFESQEALLETLERQLGAGDWILIKGSRKARMERVVRALAEEGTC